MTQRTGPHHRRRTVTHHTLLSFWFACLMQDLCLNYFSLTNESVWDWFRFHYRNNKDAVYRPPWLDIKKDPWCYCWASICFQVINSSANFPLSCLTIISVTRTLACTCVCVFFLRGFVYSCQSVWFIMLRGVVEVPEVCRRGLNEWVALTGCRMMKAQIQGSLAIIRLETDAPASGLWFSLIWTARPGHNLPSPGLVRQNGIIVAHCWQKQTCLATVSCWEGGGSLLQHSSVKVQIVLGFWHEARGFCLIRWELPFLFFRVRAIEKKLALLYVLIRLRKPKEAMLEIFLIF